jgi:hypothetical protein
MATTSRDDVIARGADVPLELARTATARDALLDPQEGDIIPDNEEKGYHVGEVRQPAEPVLTRGGDVRFESDQPSKFTGSYAEQKAELDRREQESPELYGGNVHQPLLTKPEDVEKAKARQLEAQGSGRRSTRSTEGPVTATPKTSKPRSAQPRSSGRRSSSRRGASRSAVSAEVKGPNPAAGTVDVSTSSSGE